MYLRIILCLVLLICCGAAAADTVNPYFAQVDVADGGERARRAGFDRALEQVLIKLSGREEMVQSVSPGGADRYVQQYRYLEETIEDEATGAESVRLILEVHFDPNAVQRLRSELGLPIWPLERGETAVWVAIESRGKRRLVGSEVEDEPLVAALEDAARHRALPVVLPLLDLEDQGRVSVGDVWGGFSQPVRAASDRYGAVHQMIGRIEPAGPSWQGRWILDLGAENLRWEVQADTPEQVLSAGIEGAASRLAERMAVQPATTEGALVLEVSGIESAIAYGRLSRYLRSLSVVQSVTLAAVSGGTAHFRVDTVGDSASLAQVLTLGNVLQPEDPSAPADVLRYRLDERALPR